MATIPVATAMAYLAAGLSCLPAAKAKKRPSIGGWKTWQSRLPTKVEVKAWFSNPHDAICVVSGNVSGNLECMDFDQHGELFAAWMEKVDTGLLAKLVIEQTPSGGYHVFYRSEEPVEGNLKLARGIREGEQKTLIETRGEGGLFLCAPTDGYTLQQGTFAELPVLTAGQNGIQHFRTAMSVAAYDPFVQGTGREIAIADDDLIAMSHLHQDLQQFRR